MRYFVTLSLSLLLILYNASMYFAGVSWHFSCFLISVFFARLLRFAQLESMELLIHRSAYLSYGRPEDESWQRLIGYTLLSFSSDVEGGGHSRTKVF